MWSRGRPTAHPQTDRTPPDCNPQVSEEEKSGVRDVKILSSDRSLACPDSASRADDQNAACQNNMAKFCDPASSNKIMPVVAATRSVKFRRRKVFLVWLQPTHSRSTFVPGHLPPGANEGSRRATPENGKVQRSKGEIAYASY